MVQVRQKVWYARYIRCFTCGIPQMICYGWKKEGGGIGCEFRGVLIPMVASNPGAPAGRRCDRFGVPPGWGEIRALISPARRHRPHFQRVTGLEKVMRLYPQRASRRCEKLARR
jgi:hypothetical protein